MNQPLAGAEVGDDAALGDVEGVHDLIRTLPDVAIRSFELRQVFGRKQLAVLLPLLSAGGRGQQRERDEHDRGRQAATQP